MIACWTSQWKNILRKNSSSSKIIQGSGQRGKKTKLLNSEKGPQVQIIQLLAGLSSIFYIPIGTSGVQCSFLCIFLCPGVSRSFSVPVSLDFLRVFLNYRSIFTLLHDSLYLPHRR